MKTVKISEGKPVIVYQQEEKEANHKLIKAVSKVHEGVEKMFNQHFRHKVA